MSRERARVTSIYEEYINEKEQINRLIEQGYRISKVDENLSGAFVEFTRKTNENEEEQKTLHIVTADARIHFSNLIIAEQRAL